MSKKIEDIMGDEIKVVKELPEAEIVTSGELKYIKDGEHIVLHPESREKVIQGNFASEAPTLGELEEDTPEEIWGAFTAMDAEHGSAFFQMFGYGIKEIEDIGYEKFIAGNGWTSVDEVYSWKHDQVHLMICPNCKDNFGILEMDAALCEDCKGDFHYDLVGDFDTVVDGQQGEGVAPIAYFMISEEFRDMFRNKNGLIQDVKDSEFLQLVLLQRAVNDIILTRMAKNESIKGISAGKYHKYLREYKYKKLTVFDAVPAVKDLSVEINGLNYDASHNKYNLLNISYEIARRAARLAIPR